jgi:hypothetical protein
MQSEKVPVFNCIVYVSPKAEGGMRARVANLPGIERTAATEREALSKVISAFKQSVSELIKTSQQIPWIEPIAAAESGELQRFIPVHL